jgi:ABC-2 type transport system ATP-binding protein
MTTTTRRSPTNGGLAVDVRGLRKSFGDLTVLDGVDLAVRTGTITALLGPNGSGKTTTVGILSTLLRLDGGTAHVAGYDVVTQSGSVRASIGVTGQVSAVDDLLSGVENLRLMADLHHLGRRVGRERADALLAQFGLTDAARKPVATWSGGMRRKLDLAMTLMGSPAVVFLDEPTTGLDPRSRRTLWDEVRALAAAGTTILLTTQYLEEADRLADRVAVLHGGRIVAEGTPAELKAVHDAGSLDEVFLALTEPPAEADPSTDPTHDKETVR